MSFDDYVHYMTQKYRLAVAFAVIKTKPNDIDIEKHLSNIKNKIKISKMDSNDEICEEDFDINDSECEVIHNESNDSETILKDFDLNNLENQINDKENASNSFLDVFEIINNIDHDNTTKTTFHESQCTQNSTFLNIPNEELTFYESPNEIEINDITKESELNDIINNDSQQTELYTLPDSIHISQSQDNFIISKKLITKSDKDTIINLNDRKDALPETIINKDCLNTTESNKDNTSKIISLEYKQDIKNSKRNSEDIVSDAKRIRRDDVLRNQDYCLLDKDLSRKSHNMSSLDELEYFSTLSSQNSNIIFNNKEIIHKNMFKNNDNINEDECISNNSNISDDLTESQTEIVTFKVLEELSKVKNYIKRDKRNTDSDSGYRSSQTRGSYKNTLSGTCWNESAQCLLNFLNSCQLVVSVMEITEEISKVLGKLIDKLHEEEKYPKFLEDILEIVEKLIKDVYNCRENEVSILETDEKIHRIFLLNRSSHIIKFSIEKITNILEIIAPELINTIEITQTERTENLCHIFHILEILLKRYISYEKFSSQMSSQETSQETVLKRSSLTEIWRKKWNLSKSEVFEVQSSEKKCTMTKCRDILNKITVEAIECYSLISFSALQCYNILQ